MLCGNCIAAPPPFTRGISVFQYDDVSRHMVLTFKHADRTDRAPAFANWMSRAAADILKENVLIAPVPIHRRRLRARRYNQAALLAHYIATAAGHRMVPDLLNRARDTSSQGGKSPKARFKNVKGAFSLNQKWQDRIANEHVLLIDDVFTTGATLSECANCLLQNGARQVDVLTLCRVVRPASMSI
ncbi:MAG: ComF family protein, partial [Sneathiella sp.]|nr:ComF family protein [Sneathiella sp.]